jgi:tetratricopeptide (TPR) repeat protein
MRLLRLCLAALVAALATGAALVVQAAPPTRTEALRALEQADAAARRGAIERLAEVGRMEDVDRLLARLDDADPVVRDLAASATWQIWSRSGDPAIDKLFVRGMAQMEAAALEDALATFSAIVRKKPAFAEGWNKRATVLFLLGRFEESLKDCDQVLKRNPKHFGALSGAGQIHLQLGNAERALDYFRRALAVNPNLSGAAEIVPVLEEMLRQEGPQRT